MRWQIHSRPRSSLMDVLSCACGVLSRCGCAADCCAKPFLMHNRPFGVRGWNAKQPSPMLVCSDTKHQWHVVMFRHKKHIVRFGKWLLWNVMQTPEWKSCVCLYCGPRATSWTSSVLNSNLHSIPSAVLPGCSSDMLHPFVQTTQVFCSACTLLTGHPADISCPAVLHSQGDISLVPSYFIPICELATCLHLSTSL